jgi:DNA-binding SARP family transcriptional activator
MAGRVHVRFFGPVTLQVGDNEPEPLVGKKVQALLGYLALERRAHSRDELASLLFVWLAMLGSVLAIRAPV